MALGESSTDTMNHQTDEQWVLEQIKHETSLETELS